MRLPLNQRIRAVALTLLMRQITLTSLASLAISGVLVAGLWHSVEHELLLVWLGAVLLSLGYRLSLYFAFRADPPGQADARYWGRRITSAFFIQGLLWGLAGLVFYPDADIEGRILIYALVLGQAIASLSVTLYWAPAFFAFAVPATGLLALRCLVSGGSTQTPLGVALLVFDLVGALIVLNGWRALREGIAIRFENLELVEELDRQRREARDANHGKTRFLAAASHDLKQPVYTLTLLNRVLAAENLPPEQREIVDLMARATNSLDRILSALLDISKLDAGVIQPEPVALATGRLLSDLRTEFQPLAQAKGLTLRVRDCPWTVVTDPGLLTTLLRNLIANAIRYTERGGILVACRPRDGRIVFQVWDTGIGISAKDQERIFQEFSQVSLAGRDRDEGLGLGLSVCQRIAALLGGRVRVRSRPGRGSAFEFSLPAPDTSA